MEKRAYQDSLVNTVREKLIYTPHNLCVQSPTGSGKSKMMSDLLLDPEPQIVLTHRRVLLDQLSRVLTRAGIPHGMRASGHGTNFDAPVQLAMLQTEFNRAHKTDKWPLHKCTRVHADELHAMKAMQAQAVLGKYNELGAATIGWSATPNTIDHLVDEVVIAATVRELINDGYLVQPIVYGPDMPDAELLEKVSRQKNGEFSPSGLAKIWPLKVVFGQIIEHFNILNPPGVPAVLFAPGVKQSLWFAKQFAQIGIPAAHIDGDNCWVDGKQYESDSKARQSIFERVAANDIRVVCNRFVLREGWDCPAVGHAILACPYGSRSAFAQSVGRVLRPFPGRSHAIIQDHAGNWLRHPAIDSSEPWDISTPERILAMERIAKMRDGTADDPADPSDPEPIRCPKCTAIRAVGAECPVCGFAYEKRIRLVLQLNGQLKQVSGPAYKQRIVKPKPDDHKEWERVYFGAKKHKPHRTFEQLYAYYAVNNNWRWLPRDLPLMPRKHRDWFYPVGDIEISDLI